jgi:hypothetical protein
LRRNFERLDEMLAGLHLVVFGMLMLKNLVIQQAQDM